MINYVVHHSCDLCDFPAWSGGFDRLYMLCEHPEALALIEEYLEDYLPYISDGEVTDTLINDILWFEVDDILAESGFDPDTYEKRALYA